MSFKHDPLIGNEIRLCYVYGDINADDALFLELRHFPFRRWDEVENAELPAYTALSYTWGLLSPTFEIFINGLKYETHQNLHHFLKCVVELGESNTWFWIDQICIDQANDLERNAVVQQMDMIYQSADSVRIWLGERTNESDLAFEVLGEFAALEGSEDEEGKRAALITHPRSAMALSDLFSRSYWHRQWIVQEVWFANSVRLQCGISGLDVVMSEPLQEDDSICCFHVSLLMKAWTENGQEKRYLNPIFSRDSLLSSNAPIDFAWVINRFVGECTDPRDKVFGLQGIVYPDQRVIVDYRMSVAEVFWTAVETMYRQPIPEGYWQFLELDVIINLIKLAKRMGLSGEEFDQTALFDHVKHIYIRQGWEWRIPDMRSHREKFPNAKAFEHHV